jgi:hypothetical protein
MRGEDLVLNFKTGEKETGPFPTEKGTQGGVVLRPDPNRYVKLGGEASRQCSVSVYRRTTGNKLQNEVAV